MNRGCPRTMASADHKFLLITAFVSFFTAAQPDTTDSVDIIEKLIQDLESSPSGYTFHRHSADVHPGGYDADVNHSGANIAARLGIETISSKTEGEPGTRVDGSGSLDVIRTYKSTGGYSFVVSHDYGTDTSHAEVPADAADAHYGASNTDFHTIAVMRLKNTDYSDRPGTDFRKRSEPVQPGITERLDASGEKERYDSYMEYDEAVKEGKKGSSVNPGEYYVADVDGDEEKYDSDDRYGEFTSNKRGDRGSHVGFEKYDESDGIEEYGNYDSFGGQGVDIDEEQRGKYAFPEGYSETSDFSDWKKAGPYQSYRENDDGDEYERFRANFYRPVNSDENFGTPYTSIESNDDDVEQKYENIKDYLMSDFFNDYNHFFNGADKETNHDIKFEHEDDEYYNDHGIEDARSHYREDGEEAEDFFDDANRSGNHNEEEIGEENGRFGEKKGHKSGSKTTGYHNVLNKDEYTKDHTFYENGKKNGHFDKGGEYEANNFRHEGDYEKGGNRDHGSSDDYHGESDSENKGHSFEDDLSKNNEHGHKSYHDDNLEYGNEGSRKYNTEYGDGYDSNFDSEY